MSSGTAEARDSAASNVGMGTLDARHMEARETGVQSGGFSLQHEQGGSVHVHVSPCCIAEGDCTPESPNEVLGIAWHRDEELRRSGICAALHTSPTHPQHVNTCQAPRLPRLPRPGLRRRGRFTSSSTRHPWMLGALQRRRRRLGKRNFGDESCPRSRTQVWWSCCKPCKQNTLE